MSRERKLRIKIFTLFVTFWANLPEEVVSMGALHWMAVNGAGWPLDGEQQAIEWVSRQLEDKREELNKEE